jgi:hypothetical protein
MARRRDVNIFSMSFLDCICCGFGAVILLFVVLNARSAAARNQRIEDLRGEVSRLEFEVHKAEKNLVQARNTLDEEIDEQARLEGRSRELIEQLTKIEQELADSVDTTSATEEHVNKLKADLLALEEEATRMRAAVEADREGAKLREFKGTGDRQYLTGLKVGGERILILVDCSASMLADSVVDVIVRRNLGEEEKLASAKWQQAVRTVDWLSTQLPVRSEFQLYGFHEDAFPLVDGTDGMWLDAGNPDDLNRAVEALQRRVPDKGTNLQKGFSVMWRLPSPPDNVILLTDGLPTLGTTASAGYRVSGKTRVDLFKKATRALDGSTPINVILFPMEGDPQAAQSFWNLACKTGGSFMCPSGDWP